MAVPMETRSVSMLGVQPNIISSWMPCRSAAPGR